MSGPPPATSSRAGPVAERRRRRSRGLAGHARAPPKASLQQVPGWRDRSRGEFASRHCADRSVTRCAPIVPFPSRLRHDVVTTSSGEPVREAGVPDEVQAGQPLRPMSRPAAPTYGRSRSRAGRTKSIEGRSQWTKGYACHARASDPPGRVRRASESVRRASGTRSRGGSPRSRTSRESGSRGRSRTGAS